jgi:hypothetical protein
MGPGAGGGGGGGAGNDGAELLLSVTPFPVKTNVFCILCTERTLFARNCKRKKIQAFSSLQRYIFRMCCLPFHKVAPYRDKQ